MGTNGTSKGHGFAQMNHFFSKMLFRKMIDGCIVITSFFITDGTFIYDGLSLDGIGRHPWFGRFVEHFCRLPIVTNTKSFVIILDGQFVCRPIMIDEHKSGQCCKGARTLCAFKTFFFTFFHLRNFSCHSFQEMDFSQMS